MKNTDGLIKVLFTGPLPKKKYSDADELATDLAEALYISKDKLVVELISLPDIKGDKGDKGDRGVAGPQGPDGTAGSVGPAGDDGTSLVYKSDWVVATNYDAGDIVRNPATPGILYICHTAHVSNAADEPGVGIDEALYWDEYNIITSVIVMGFATLLDAATVDWDANAGAAHQNAKLVIGGNRTIALNGWTDGMHGTLVVTQDGVGGHSLTLPANSLVQGAGAGAVTLTAAANAVDVLDVFYDGTDYFWKHTVNFT
jgi:hypothetical protein